MPLHLMLGLCLFVTFLVVFFFMLPGSSVESVRLEEVTSHARAYRGEQQPGPTPWFSNSTQIFWRSHSPPFESFSLPNPTQNL